MVNSAFHIRQKGLFAYLLGFVAVLVISSFWLINPQVAIAASDTCTWTGSGGDTNMSTAGNWTGCDNGNVPQDGDTLVFPSGPTNKSVTVNSDMGFDSITFSGSGYTVSSAASESLGVYSSFTISGNNNVFSGYVRLYPATLTTLTHSGSGTSFANYLVVQPSAANTDVIFHTSTDLDIPMISQTAVNGSSSVDSFTKTGEGTLQITGASITGLITSGGIHIQEGALTCDTSNCLGDGGNEIFLEDGADPNGPSLYLNGDDTVPNPITIDTGDGQDASVHVGAEITLSGAITGTTNLNMFVTGDNTLTISSNVALANGTTMVLYGAEGYTTNRFVFNGIVSGDADIVVDDAHVTLSGSNTYTGTTELNDTGSGSLVTVKDNNSLGNHGPSSGTIVNSGNTLNFDNAGDIGFEEPITVGGTGVGGSYPGALVKTDQYVSLGGGITLTSDSLWHNETSELFTISSTINGFYDLTLTGVEDNGGFNLAPGGENAFGDVVANGIQLLISGANHTAIPENLTMNAENGKLSRIWLNNSNTLSEISIVTLNNDTSQDAVLINTGVSESLGTIVGDGLIFMVNGDASFSLGTGETSGEFTGTVQGYEDSQFQIIDGVWTFSGYNTEVSGNGFSSYYVNGGKFIANAADTSLSMSPFSVSSGVLGGTELIGPVTVYAGTIAPGNSPGCLYPAGDVAFNDVTSFLNVEINGTTACSGYDVMNASGNVVLNGAVLNVDILADYDSVYGNEFTIVRGAVVAGTFNDLADGETFTVGNSSFRINYTPTTVVLTDVTTDDSSTASLLADSGSSIFEIAAAATVLLTISSYLLIKRQLSRRRYAR